MADDNTSPKDPAEKTSTDKSGENKSKEPNDHSPRDFPEKGLGADRMVKELQDRYDKLRDWTDARGLTDPSDRQNDRGDQHFFAKDAPPLLLFRDTAAERSYHLG